MTYNFPYLKDSSFLKEFDEIRLKEQFVKLTVLTFDEQPIEEIQGKVISGSFNIDGTSSMRRTGNINLVADEYNNFRSAMEKMKQIPIVYISTMGLAGGDFDVELNDEQLFTFCFIVNDFC